MIVLHAAHVSRRFFIWGEASGASSEAGSAGQRAVRTGGRRRSDPPALSFGASDKALLAALEEMRPGLSADIGANQFLTVLLPTLRRQPLASSPLIGALPEDVQPNGLAPFRVLALPLGTAALIDLLAATLDQTIAQPGIIVGADWTFWGHGLRFAAGLAMRQQFLPGLAKVDGCWYARWDAIYVDRGWQQCGRSACSARGRRRDRFPQRRGRSLGAIRARRGDRSGHRAR